MDPANRLQLGLLGRFRLGVAGQEIRLPTGKAMLVLACGESLLSHGAESTFVFGLNGRSSGSAEAALKAAKKVRDSSAEWQAVACGCASGLVHIDAEAYPVGSVVQRAARLALLAEAGDLLVDRAVLAQIPARRRVEQVTTPPTPRGDC